MKNALHLTESMLLSAALGLWKLVDRLIERFGSGAHHPGEMYNFPNWNTD